MAILSSVQSGQVVSSGATQVVTLGTTVDPAKSISFITWDVDSASPSQFQWKHELSALGDQLTLARSSSGTTTTIRWWVLEFESGVTVQRGKFVSGDDGDTQSLSPAVDLTKTFILQSFMTGGSTFGDDDFVRLTLANDTQELSNSRNLIMLNSEAASLSDGSELCWQVVEYDECVVQHIELTDTQLSLALPSQVLLAKSMVINSYQCDVQNKSRMDQYMLRAFLSGPGRTADTVTVEAHDSMPFPFTANVMVVEFTDSTKVGSAQFNLLAGQLTAKYAHGLAGDEHERAMLMTSGFHGTATETSYPNDDSAGPCFFRLEFDGVSPAGSAHATRGDDLSHVAEITAYAPSFEATDSNLTVTTEETLGLSDTSSLEGVVSKDTLGVTDTSNVIYDPALTATDGVNLAESSVLVLEGVEKYVSTTGNDSTGDGSFDNPWRTIQFGYDQLQPGETLVIRGGTYIGGTGINDRVLLVNNNGGTLGSPKTVKGFEGENVIIDGQQGNKMAIEVINTDHFNLYDIEILEGKRTGFYFENSGWLHVRNVYVHDCRFEFNAIWGGGRFIKCNDFIYEDSMIHDCNLGIEFRESPGQTSATAFVPPIAGNTGFSQDMPESEWDDWDGWGYGCKRGIIKNCIFFDAVHGQTEHGDNVQLRYPEDSTVEDCIAWSPSDDNFDGLAALRCNFIGNIGFLALGPGDGDGNGMKIGVRGGLDCFASRNIMFRNKRSGLDMSDTERAKAYNNTCDDNQNWGGIAFEASRSSIGVDCRGNISTRVPNKDTIGFFVGGMAHQYHRNNTVDDNSTPFYRAQDSGEIIEANPFVNRDAAVDVVRPVNSTIPEYAQHIRDQVHAMFQLVEGSPSRDSGEVIPGWIETYVGSGPDRGALEASSTEPTDIIVQTTDSIDISDETRTGILVTTIEQLVLAEILIGNKDAVGTCDDTIELEEFLFGYLNLIAQAFQTIDLEESADYILSDVFDETTIDTVNLLEVDIGLLEIDEDVTETADLSDTSQGEGNVIDVTCTETIELLETSTGLVAFIAQVPEFLDLLEVLTGLVDLDALAIDDMTPNDQAQGVQDEIIATADDTISLVDIDLGLVEFDASATEQIGFIDNSQSQLDNEEIAQETIGLSDSSIDEGGDVREILGLLYTVTGELIRDGLCIESIDISDESTDEVLPEMIADDRLHIAEVSNVTGSQTEIVTDTIELSQSSSATVDSANVYELSTHDSLSLEDGSNENVETFAECTHEIALEHSVQERSIFVTTEESIRIDDFSFVMGGIEASPEVSLMSACLLDDCALTSVASVKSFIGYGDDDLIDDGIMVWHSGQFGTTAATVTVRENDLFLQRSGGTGTPDSVLPFQAYPTLQEMVDGINDLGTGWMAMLTGIEDAGSDKLVRTEELGALGFDARKLLKYFNECQIVQMINAASAKIHREAGRRFCADDYVEVHEPDRTLVLNNWPIIRVYQVAIGTRDLIRIKNISADAAEAFVEAVRGESITLVVHGGANDGRQTITFGSVIAEMQDLVDEINNNHASRGWQATLVADDNLPVEWVISHGGKPALDESMILLGMGEPIAGYRTDWERGLIKEQGGWAGSSLYGPQHAPALGGDTGQVCKWSNSRTKIYVEYRGGFDPLPADIEELANELILENISDRSKASGLKSEKLGDYSWERAECQEGSGITISPRLSQQIKTLANRRI